MKRHPLLLMALTIILNISWTLVHGLARDAVTITAVLTFACASAAHAFHVLGARKMLWLFGTVVAVSLVAELVGIHTGVIFGDYVYSTRLGVMLSGLPLLIPLAWFMMLYPSLYVGWTLTRTLNGKPQVFISSAISAWIMATWDLFLDPQMVSEGYWTWLGYPVHPTPVIPLSNFIGWLVVAFLIAWIATNNLPISVKRDISRASIRSTLLQFPIVAICWVWLGSTLANAVPVAPFLAQPVTATQGFVGMGIIVIPWLIYLWRSNVQTENLT